MCRGVVILQLFAVGSGCFSAGAGEECEEVVPELSPGRSSFLYFLFVKQRGADTLMRLFFICRRRF